MVDCINNPNESMLYGLMFIFWVLANIWWQINIKYLNSNSVKSLHHILSFTVTFKTLLSLFSFLNSYTCSTSSLIQYWQLGFGSSYCLYNTFLYTSLLLISKGYCFTRDYFESNEIHLVALIMGGIYIVFSIYLLEKSYFIILILATIVYIWYSVIRNSSTIKDVLKQRISMMSRNHVTVSIQATKTKLSMINCYTVLVSIYFFIEIGYICIYIWYMVNDMTKSSFYNTVTDSVEEFFEIVGVFGICILFMPKNRGQYFDLPEFDIEGPMAEITPMYNAHLDPRVTQPPENLLFLVKHPEEDKDNNIKSFMIALPMTLVHRRGSIDQLNEPLLLNRIDND